MLLSFNLTGKRALITGGTQGIGEAIAEGLAHAGATVLINARNQQKLDECMVRMLQKGFRA